MTEIRIGDLQAWFSTIGNVMAAHADELCEMDAKMGDGDLGLTMKKGFQAMPDILGGIDEADLGKKLMKAGMKMASVVPSTMGTLMASGVMTGGKELAGRESIDAAGFLTFLKGYAAGIAKRGKCARGERTVLDLLPEKIRMRKVGPVGRLDKDVTGLLILTTDGQLAHRLISPKWDVEKTYYAEIEGEIDDECVRRFAEGVPLKEFTCKPARLERAGAGACRVYVSEGKYHQVKRMLAAVGHPVLRLKREKIGPVALDPALSEGEFRPLTPGEEAALYEIAGMTKHE